MDFLADILGQLAPVGAMAFGTLVSVGVVYGNRYLKAKTGNESVHAVGETIGAVVNDLAATIVKEIKAKSADGRLTKNEALDVKDMAVAQVKDQLPKAVAKSAQAVVGNLDAFVAGKIEEKVKDLATKVLKTE